MEVGFWKRYVVDSVYRMPTWCRTAGRSSPLKRPVRSAYYSLVPCPCPERPSFVIWLPLRNEKSSCCSSHSSVSRLLYSIRSRFLSCLRLHKWSWAYKNKIAFILHTLFLPQLMLHSGCYRRVYTIEATQLTAVNKQMCATKAHVQNGCWNTKQWVKYAQATLTHSVSWWKAAHRGYIHHHTSLRQGKWSLTTIGKITNSFRPMVTSQNHSHTEEKKHAQKHQKFKELRKEKTEKTEKNTEKKKKKRKDENEGKKGVAKKIYHRQMVQ